MKQQASEKVGIGFNHEILPENITESKLLSVIQSLNNDKNVHGIIVQLPLPLHLDSKVITESIDPRKDVDGFHSLNIGMLAKRESEPSFVACTPKGILHLLKKENISLDGKRAVVIGRSNIVGMPVAHLLQHENATVTVCHSKTVGMEAIVKEADIGLKLLIKLSLLLVLLIL
jgi:methylenetetrahydrofolate dehydrogenase (NADP+)/methenyltetrahydrofolate cyclohydrolase/formyltetrahydrofolate synthetase